MSVEVSMSDVEPRKAPFMRPPKITTIPKDSYEKLYWPSIKDALIKIINNPTVICFSQEELYRAIYNVCCQRHTITLYNDLLRFIGEQLAVIQSTLLNCSTQFVELASRIICNYKRIVEVICALFRYLDKVYVQDKLKSTLNSILLNHFSNIVMKNTYVKQAFAHHLQLIPPNTDPTMLMNLVKDLFEFDKSYATMNPTLFSKYIPCLQPSRGLEHDIKETLQFIQELRSQGFGHQEGLWKRKYSVVEST